jgi:GntR family transcriptional regulator, transcriptional repressor for pyruvate dehydrogenase complex
LFQPRSTQAEVNADTRSSGAGRRHLNAGAQTLAHVRGLIEQGLLRPGDRLASARELVRQVGVSRTSVLQGLRSLVAMGIVTTRRGSGAFITAGPPALASEPLVVLTALHGIGRGRLFEAARLLESSTAALAAERSTGDQLASISDEVIGMYAAEGDSRACLVHDVRFHKAVAAGANNLVLAALVEMVASLHIELLPSTIDQTPRRLGEVADMHRRIYLAIRARDAEAARAAMDAHLRFVEAHRAVE